jgi:hypothetical protein
MAYLCTYPGGESGRSQWTVGYHVDAKGIADLALGVVQYTSITPII